MTDLGMTGLFAALSASKASIMTVFGVLAVVSVVGLERFRAWLGRHSPEDKNARVYEIAAAVTVVFMVMLVMGGTDMAVEGKKFLNLSFGLFGVAGVAIVALLMRRFRLGLPLDDASELDDGEIDEDELRKMQAHDL